VKRYFSGPVLLLGGLWCAWVIFLIIAGIRAISPAQLQWDWFDILVLAVFLLPGWGQLAWLFYQRAAVQGQFSFTWRRAPLLIRPIAPNVVEVIASGRTTILKLFFTAGMITAILASFRFKDPAHPLLIIQAHLGALLSLLGVLGIIFLWIQNWRQRIVFELHTATATVQTYEFGWLSGERSLALPQPVQACHHRTGPRASVEHETRWTSVTGQKIVIWHINWEEGAWFWEQLRAAGIAVVPRSRYQ
jgi:hypothetical protein